MIKVLIPTKLDPIAAKHLTEHGYEVVQTIPDDLAAFVSENADAHALIVRSEKITPEIIDLLPNLKAVVRAGAGYNTIDIKYARKQGVSVMNTPGANANAVAEEVVGLMLANARHFIAGDKSVRAGLWEKAKFMGTEVTGKTVGIVGFGNIGQLLAKRLKGFENTIKIFDPYVSKDKAAEFNVEICDLEEIFSTCDYISLHIPATPTTTGLINKDFFAMMKDGATIINCARCEVINEEDLREAKKDKTIYYLNDVYPKDAAGEKSVCDVAEITLPHLGASTKEANSTAAMRSATQLIDFIEKGVSTYVVNRTVPDGLDESYQELAFTVAKIAKSYLGKSSSPVEIKTSFFGKLHKFKQYLIPSVIAGIDTSFDPVNDYKDAESYLETKGITLKVIEPSDDDPKAEALVVELVQEGASISRAAVRGTLAEDNIIISCINDFDKLYFEPEGHNIIFVYQDRPGVLAEITRLVAYEGINIDDIRSPHNIKGDKSIAVLKVNKGLTEDAIEKLKQHLECQVGFHVQI